MRIVFMGTPEFAVPALKKIVEAKHQVVGVFTQPERPVGREQLVTPPPVKRWAIQQGLKAFSPESIKNQETRELLSGLAPEVIIVVAFGRILPPWMLELPPYGAINVHASLLPKYRGAAPIQWAIANGEAATGVTTMQMDAGLDTGDILLQKTLPVLPEDTSSTLNKSLSNLGADLLVQTLDELKASTLHRRKQDSSQASVAPILKKEDGILDWRWPAAKIHNHVRGFNPWPGTYTHYQGRILKILKTDLAEESTIPAEGNSVQAGVLFVAGKHTAIAKAGDANWLVLREVQPEGRKKMSGSDFVNGFRIENGARLG
ncbi:MAG: methionyl-tRNA formyltransferase, partial [Acidobacteriia bacterium]|nr:methionyl-tRNA formyltransferase [Terriglobia bacterium]